MEQFQYLAVRWRLNSNTLCDGASEFRFVAKIIPNLMVELQIQSSDKRCAKAVNLPTTESSSIVQERRGSFSPRFTLKNLNKGAMPWSEGRGKLAAFCRESLLTMRTLEVVSYLMSANDNYFSLLWCSSDPPKMGIVRASGEG